MTTTNALRAAPAELVDPATRNPQFGTYTGNLPPIDFTATGASRAAILTQGKRWLYVIVVSEEVICGAAVVRLGYGSNAFAFAIDRRERGVIADFSAKAPAFAASVSPHAGEGAEAKFGLGPKQLSIDRPIGSKTYFVNIRDSQMKLDVRMSVANAPPPLAVINKLSGGRFSTTEKGALLEVDGSLAVGSKKYDLKGAWGGYDYTAGLLERHTAWNWAFGMGRSSDGKLLAYNLTQGFVGERECVAWREGHVDLIGAARFSFDAHNGRQPWRVQTDKLDVDFAPIHPHQERHNLIVLRSHFLQVGGDFRGKLVLPNETVTFENLGGVTEDQDTIW